MKRLFAAGAIACASLFSVFAAHVEPGRALCAALGGGHGMKAPAEDVELVASYDMPGSDEIALYVFTLPGGFIIASADDAAPAMLAYGESEFDPDNIPSNVRWWLDQCTAYVGRCALPGAAPYRQHQRAQRQPIAPICKTRWNQTSPFNNDCPVLGGQRAVTGCVATAMAQVMKAHDWPVTGIGSHSYTFKYNNTDYTESFNFGATTFDWSNMSNAANGGNSSQRAEVAKLMHACGVACDMGYSPSGSGAYTIIAAAGLIKYLDYDKGMRMLKREWYSASQWDDIVYGEIAAGRPLMYAGDDTEVGHEFVCDGYSAGGFYHINWGWGGYYDGYFLLSDLYPEGQGTGGGSGNQGYNNNQEIVVGIQPPVDGSEVMPSVAFDSPIEVPVAPIPRDAWHDVTIKGTGYSWGDWTWGEGFTNYTLAEQYITMALMLVDADGAESFIEAYTSRCGVWGVLGPMTIPSEQFPVGEYDVYPVCRIGASDWQAIYSDIDSSPASLRFTVSAGEISILPGAYTADLRAHYAGFEGVGGWERGFYPGRSYGAEFNVSSNTAVSRELRAALIDASGAIACESDPIDVVFESRGVKLERWSLSLPPSLPVGDYYIAVVDDGGNALDAPSPVSVVSEPLIVAGIVTGIAVDGDGTPVLYRGAENRISMDVVCNMQWSGEITLRLLKRNSTTGKYTSAAVLGSRDMELAPGQSCPVEWMCNPQANNGTYYLALTYAGEGGSLEISNAIKVKVAKTTGVEPAAADGEGSPAALYDLTGRPASDAAAPGIYIAPRSDGKADKILLR